MPTKKKSRKGPINHYDFVRDLERGAVGEDIVVAFFKEQFGLIADNVSTRNSDFDLLVKKLDSSLSQKRNVVSKEMLKKIFREAFDCSRREQITIEVKYDEAATRYKNLFIELFFDIDTGSPGAVFKCKADIIAWVVPEKKGSNRIYLFKRPEFLTWIFDYIFSNRKIELKTPGISPKARGVVIPISEIKECYACVGEYTFKF